MRALISQRPSFIKSWCLWEAKSFDGAEMTNGHQVIIPCYSKTPMAFVSSSTTSLGRAFSQRRYQKLGEAVRCDCCEHCSDLLGVVVWDSEQASRGLPQNKLGAKVLAE